MEGTSSNDMITASVIVASEDSTADTTDQKELLAFRRMHYYFMVAVLPLFVLVLGTLFEGWSWWFAGIMAIYTIVMSRLLKDLLA